MAEWVVAAEAAGGSVWGSRGGGGGGGATGGLQGTSGQWQEGCGGHMGADGDPPEAVVWSCGWGGQGDGQGEWSDPRNASLLPSVHVHPLDMCSGTDLCLSHCTCPVTGHA